MIIYLLLNEPERAYPKLKESIFPENLKNEFNRRVLKKLYEELEKGNININQILDELEEKDVNDLTEIMAYDFEITDIEKALEDLIVAYDKEKLIQRRNEILKQLEEENQENVSQLENELNDIILKLAKMK